MRVNPHPMPDLLAALAQTEQQINTNLQQISTGQRISVPADDPAAAAMLVQNADQASEVDQFQRSLTSVLGEMQNADSTLSSVVTTLQRAISLGVEGANGTLNASDRAALAQEVRGIQSQLLGLANATYQGNYIFGGTMTQTQPYIADTGSGSGVTYQGNDLSNSVTLGSDFTLQSNLPGSQLFSASGKDMFQAIQDLITSLQTGDGITTAVNEVSDAYNYIGAQRVFYGNAMNQLNSQQTTLNHESTQLASQQNSLGAVDLPTAITNLTSSELARQATLEAIGSNSRDSLFDYLK